MPFRKTPAAVSLGLLFPLGKVYLARAGLRIINILPAEGSGCTSASGQRMPLWRPIPGEKYMCLRAGDREGALLLIIVRGELASFEPLSLPQRTHLLCRLAGNFCCGPGAENGVLSLSHFLAHDHR